MSSPATTLSRAGNVVGVRTGEWTRVASVVLCCAIAAVLRLHHLGYKSYWLDEAVSLQIAHLPSAAFGQVIRSAEANMALYYGLLRLWVRLGDNEAQVRLLSCLIGVLTIPVLYAIGARLFDRRTGLLAAALLTVDTSHMWASQEARSYALVVLLTTASWWLLLRAVDRRGATGAVWAWSCYVITAALAVYAHFYAGLVLVAQGIAVLTVWMPRQRADERDMSSTPRLSPRVLLACALALCALLLPLALFMARPHHNIDWIAGGQRGVYATLHTVLEPAIHPTSDFGLAEVIGLAIAGPATLAVAWRRHTIIADRWRWTLLLFWLCVPLVLAIVISLIVRPIVDRRYLIVLLPPLILLAAAGLTQLWPPRPMRAMLLLIAAIDASSIYWYYHAIQNEDWRDVATYVLSQARPGDQLVFYAPYMQIPFDLYRRKGEKTATRPVGPTAWPVEPRGNQTFAEAIADARSHAPRVWIILSHDRDPACGHTIDDFLRQRFTQVAPHSFNLVRVFLYAAPTTTADRGPWASEGGVCE
jgi:mannosyltransferase